MRITKAFIAKLEKNPKNVLDELSDDDIVYVCRKADEAYHNKGTPLFSDDLYDLIKSYANKRNPETEISKDVGAPIKDGKKTKLPYYMGSMDKNKGDEKTLIAFKNKYPGNYVVSDKLDGISALLYIKREGVADYQVRMFTRGDGKYGQDVSHILSKININPPHSLLTQLLDRLDTDELTVRGELILTKKDFEKVSDQGANGRNMVAGIVNAKKPNQKILSLVRFVAHSMFTPLHPIWQQYQTLTSLGFNVVKHSMLSKEELTFDNLSDILIERRKSSLYEIDGIIICHDGLHNLAIDKNPEYAFAFKSILTQETAEVTVTNIEWNISKDGYLIPVITFDPVQLSGVKIARASGFNGQYISDNVIGPGSRILITRSGDVIPYVLKVITPSASGEPQMPDIDYEWTSTNKDIVATNMNEDQQLRILENFFVKAKVPGLRAGNIKKLYDAGYKTIGKIINASTSELAKVPGLQARSAQIIVDNIKSVIDYIPCTVLMDASNAFGRGFGEKRLSLIIEAFPDILTDNEFVPTLKDLKTVEGISDKTASAFISGLAVYRKFVKDEALECIGHKSKKKRTAKTSDVDTDIIAGVKNLSLKESANPKVRKVLTNEVIVFSGFRNKELKEQLEEMDNEVADNYTKSTTILVVKDPSSTSSKVEKAKKDGTKVISLTDLLDKLKNGKSTTNNAQDNDEADENEEETVKESKSKTSEGPIVKLSEKNVLKNSKSYKDEVFVFSGFRNNDLREKLEDMGNEVVDYITKKTTILVVKDLSATSTKVEKAKQNGIKVISLDDVLEKLGESKNKNKKELINKDEDEDDDDDIIQVGKKIKKLSIKESTKSAKQKTTKQADVVKEKKSVNNSKSYKNEVFVFSGFRNKELREKLEDMENEVVDYITKKTTILVVKDLSATSTKVEKAKKDGIKIISLDELQRYINLL